MFDSLKSMGAMASLLQNKDKLQDVGARVKERVGALRVEGVAGQGAVRAVVSGTMKVVSLDIQPALASGMAADERTRELAQGMIAEAVNTAQASAQDRAREIIEAELEAAGLGDLSKQIASQMGGQLGGGSGGSLGGLLS